MKACITGCRWARVSVQQQIDQSSGQFGYNEVTHQFQMPPPSGRPELTIYGSRATHGLGHKSGCTLKLSPQLIAPTGAPDRR